MSDDGKSGQLDLFGAPAPAPRRAPTAPMDAGPRAQSALFAPPAGPEDHRADALAAVPAARVDNATAALATHLPHDLWMGTSSWSFPGWRDVVWARQETPQRLARKGLAAYSSHPLLRAVGVDRSYYGPIPEATLRGWAEQTRQPFRFLLKAHSWCTLGRFPDHPSYGPRAGEDNPHFLDPEYAADAVIWPAIRGLGDQLGCILFQFAPQASAASRSAAEVTARLRDFLGALPHGPVYAVELRASRLLTDDYAQVLADTGAVHCFNHHPAMLPLRDQRARVPVPRRFVGRWMLRRNHDYGDAKDLYAPFDQLAEPDPETRASWVDLIGEAADASPEGALVIVNNKAEGSSPRSVVALAESIAETRT